MTELGLVGPGRVGRGIAHLLTPDRFHVGPVLSSSLTSARRAARLMHLGEPTHDPEDLRNCKAVLVAVPDGALDSVVEHLADVTFSYRSKVVLHTSLERGSEALAPLQRIGAAVGALRPLYGFQHPVLSLAGVHFAFEGSPTAGVVARRIVRTLKAEFQLVTPAQAAHQTVAHSLASDILTGLLESSIRQMVLSGYSRRRALKAVSKIAEITITDYARSGQKSRPGPLLQNGSASMQETLAALREVDKEAAEDYSHSAMQTLRILGQGEDDQ